MTQIIKTTNLYILYESLNMGTTAIVRYEDGLTTNWNTGFDAVSEKDEVALMSVDEFNAYCAKMSYS